MRNIFFFSILIVFFSCTSTDKTDSENDSLKTDNEITEEIQEKPLQTYAVVWDWKIKDKDYFHENSEDISNELMKLWEDGIVENAYFNHKAEFDKFENFPNISFFIRSENLSHAENILNDLTIVKKGISAYTLHQVGVLWLERNEDAISKLGIFDTYVTVWTTSKELESDDAILKDQFDTILELWNTGKIENAYFDIEGTQISNDITDFVFYINAPSIKAAKELADNLPFTKEGIATYKIYPAGIFWLGLNNSKIDQN